MRLKIFYSFSSIAALLFFLYVFFNTIGYNLFTVEHDNRLFMSKVLPEGWAFFTRSPREEIVELYQFKDKQWKFVDIKNNHPDNLFGVKRQSRRVAMEMSIMYEMVKTDSLWTHSRNLEKIVFPTKSIPVNNETLSLLKNGEYAILKRDITPWSWRNIVTKKNTKYAIIRVKPCKIKMGTKE